MTSVSKFTVGEPVPLIFRTEPTGKDEECTIYWDLDPAFLKETSEIELLDAFDEWLSPIVLCSLIQQIKTGRASRA